MTLLLNRDPAAQTAKACGISLPALRQLRSLVEQRTRAAWDCGDLLVATYGPPTGTGVCDGSYERLERLAVELGVSRSWLISVRACSAAWPLSQRRPTLAWHVHRLLVTYPDRVARLDRFVKHCERQKVTPSFANLRIWLDSLAVQQPRLGRPRVDPVERELRRCLALPRDDLVRLVAKLSEALQTAQAA